MSDYSEYIKTQYQNDLQYCKSFIFSFGSNFFLATHFFGKRIFEATIFFYAFLRYGDELVDNPEIEMKGQTHNGIDEYISEFNSTCKEGSSPKTHPTIRGLYELFNRYNIPFDYIHDFFKIMKQDLCTSRYKSYTELKNYMWGSASIVGHVMTHIIGYTNTIAFQKAVALAEGMQLANFLRDVNEDYQERGRIYLPLNDMSAFGVDEKMISGKKMTPELYNFIHHYVKKTEELFNEGIAGICYLKSGRFAITLASNIYRENINILKKRNYDIFGSKIKISKARKIRVFLSTLLRYLFKGSK